jgi:hypothetical protein
MDDLDQVVRRDAVRGGDFRDGTASPRAFRDIDQHPQGVVGQAEELHRAILRRNVIQINAKPLAPSDKLYSKYSLSDVWKRPLDVASRASRSATEGSRMNQTLSVGTIAIVKSTAPALES